MTDDKLMEGQLLGGYSLSTEIVVPDDCELIEDADNLLLLDLDTPDACWTFLYNFSILRQVTAVNVVDTWTSRGGNLHARITLDRQFPLTIRNAMQLGLGSDPKRGMLTLLYEGNVLFKPLGSDPKRGMLALLYEVNVLFKPKDENKGHWSDHWSEEVR
jgi:hypothetical protein